MPRKKVNPPDRDPQLALIFDPPDERSPEAGDLGALSTFGGVETDNKTDLGREQAGGADADRESADGYRMVVVQLSERWRVILCPVGIQWIVQRRRNAGRRGGEWKSLHFCTTREKLIERCDASCCPIGAAERAILLGLPEYCGGDPTETGPDTPEPHGGTS
jgi:hypothetical protein